MIIEIPNENSIVKWKNNTYDEWKVAEISDLIKAYERPQGKLKEYKPLEPDYNVQCAVENLKTAYWSNDSEKYTKVFTEAEEIIVSAICHHGYSVCKQPQGEWLRKEDVIHHIAKQYSEHNEIVPIWLSIADMRDTTNEP